MDLETLRSYCLAKPGTSEDMPFGESVLVIRVLGKMFALIMLDSVPTQLNLKCDPERAVELRERFESVLPGYHQNKKHWNTVLTGGDVPASELRSMIDHSYELVVAGLTKKERAALEGMQ